MLPAEARTHLPLYGSTDASEKITAWAPAASAVRSTVPALPGSRTLARMATSGGRVPAMPGPPRSFPDPVPGRGTARSSGTSTNPHTASRPCGVTVCARSLMTSPLTVCTGTPARARPVTRSPCRARASAVTNSSATGAPHASASETACGPSARKARARSRNARLVSRRAAFSRGDRTLVCSRLAEVAINRLPPSMNRCRWARRVHRGLRARWTRRSGRGLGLAGLAGVLGQRLSGHLDQRGERGRVGHGEVGQHPPVNLHTRGLQTLDEPVVRNAVAACRGVDALDPQPPEGALAVLAVAVRVGHRVEHLLLGLAVHPRPLATVATRPLQHDPALLVGVGRPFHACHRSLLPLSSRIRLLSQQLPDLLDVVLRDRPFPVEPGGPAGRLVLEQVITVGAPAHHLPGTGHLEPLRGAAVRLHLRHGRRRLHSLNAPRMACLSFVPSLHGGRLWAAVTARATGGSVALRGQASAGRQPADTS